MFVMLPPVIAALGTMIFWLSGVCTVVAKMPMSWTAPVTPPALITSPRSNGRKMRIITPLAKFDRLPCSARPTANPADANSATRLVVSIPTAPSEAMAEPAMTVQRVI